MAIDTTWTGDTKPIIRELDKLRKANVRLEEQMRGLTRQSKKATAEERQLARAAKRVYDETRTPQERHINRMRELNKMLAAGVIKHDTFRRAARQSQDEAARGGRRARASTEGWLTSLIKMGATYLSIRQTLGYITQELRDQEELREAAREKVVEVVPSQAAAIRMIEARVPLPERAKFYEQIEDMAMDVTPTGGAATLYRAAAAALSGSASDMKASLEAVREAARVAPESAEEITEIAGAILGLSKVTGVKDASQNLGLLLGVVGQARAEDIATVARNLTKGIVGIKAYGGTPQEAGAIAAALTQAMEDKMTRMGATAGTSLAARASEFFEQRGEIQRLHKAGMPLDQIAELTGTTVEKARDIARSTRDFTEAMSPLQMIERLRKDAELRRQFLQAYKFEVKAQAPIEQLLGVPGRGEMAWQYLQGALPMMLGGKEAEEAAEAMIRAVEEPWEQRIAAQQRGREIARERVQRLTPGGRKRAEEAAVTSVEMRKDLEAMGVDIWRRRLETVLYYWKGLFAVGEYDRSQRYAEAMLPYIQMLYGEEREAAEEVYRQARPRRRARVMPHVFYSEEARRLHAERMGRQAGRRPPHVFAEDEARRLHQQRMAREPAKGVASELGPYVRETNRLLEEQNALLRDQFAPRVEPRMEAERAGPDILRPFFGRLFGLAQQDPVRLQAFAMARRVADDPERGHVQRAMAQRAIILLETFERLLTEQNALLQHEPASSSPPPITPPVPDYTAESAFTN